MRDLLLRRGDRGPRIAVLRQQLAAASADVPEPAGDADVFDDALDLAVRAFQQHRGITADGLVGPDTGRALDSAHWTLGDRILRYTPGHLVVGDDVVALQRRLVQLGLLDGRVDGRLGSETERALRELQRASGIVADGTCGPETLRVLAQLTRTVSGGDPVGLRAHEAVRRAGSSLVGRVVVIDPAAGGEDRGVQGQGLSEADITLDLAQRLEGRLAALGVTAVLTRGPDQNPTDTERARLADEVSADVLLSLHCDVQDHGSRAPSAQGVGSGYWGDRTDAVRSPVGARLADLVQREITARTPLVDLRSHPRTWDLLRLTRMPAVRIDLGYLSHPDDAAVLRDDRQRDTIAEGLLAALQRLVLPEEEDAPTGTLFLEASTAR